MAYVLNIDSLHNAINCLDFVLKPTQEEQNSGPSKTYSFCK